MTMRTTPGLGPRRQDLRPARPGPRPSGQTPAVAALGQDQRDTRRHRPRSRRWLALLISAALSASGCTAAGDGSAARGADYFEALHEASSPEFASLAQFAAPEATFFMAMYDGAQATGRPALAQMLREGWEGAPASLTTDEPAYVSADGALDPSRLGWSNYVVPQAPVLRMSAGGFLDYSWHASITSGESYVDIDPEPSEALAAAYLAAWHEGAPEGFDALYAPGATVTDSLLGIVAGTSALVEAAADPTTLAIQGATIREIPDDGGAALYARQDRIDGELGPDTHLVILLDVPGAEDCPGQVGVLLSLDVEGLIASEERFHRVDAVDRCVDLDGREVWWDDVTIPVQNGSLFVGGSSIQLWNATVPREQLLKWSVGRYSDNYLPPPEIHSVTFTLPGPDPWGTFVAGSADIPLPASAAGCPEQGCSRWPADARAEALTALAHAWLGDPTRRILRDDYEASVGQAWTATPGIDQRYPPLGPAAYRAAHVLAWGLMDEPHRLPDDIADLSCDELAADFLLLTGSAPTAATCPEPTG